MTASADRQASTMSDAEKAGAAINSSYSTSTTSAPADTTTSMVHRFLGSSLGRLLLLTFLVANLASCTLLQRYTLVVSGSVYLPTAAVFAAELQKLVIAVVVSLLWEHGNDWRVREGRWRG